MFDLKSSLKLLPDLPGVYLMHDKDDTIIYVGKAKNLKNRVRSYFIKNKSHTPKVEKMVKNVAWFEYIITTTELEALILECTLIKKHMPFYNILLKDDKTYPYIKVTMNEKYPKMYAVRKKEKDKAKYFGPFSGMGVVKDMNEIVKNIFMIPTCRLSFPKDIGKYRPCINAQIGKCFAPCGGGVSQEEYYDVFLNVCKFLSGDHGELLADMERKMQEYSKNLEFEKAAHERDKINSVKRFEARQKVVSEKWVNRDVISFDCCANRAFFAVLFVRKGRVVAHKNMSAAGYGDFDDAEIACEFLKSFYSQTDDLPDEIIIKTSPDDSLLLAEWLSERKGKKVLITAPQRGEKLALITMAGANVMQSINRYKEENLKEKKEKIRIEAMKEKLSLPKVPIRIESYDISNTGDSDRVGVMCVFENGIYSAKKSRYFKIKYVSGQDDYACMSEVITRRINRAKEEIKNNVPLNKAAFLPLPDLILLDGGSSHVSTIKKTVSDLGENISIWGMAKDDKHTFSFFTDAQNNVYPSKNSEVYKLAYTISERVHKSAIEYHRKLRSKSAFKSELDNIAGIGPKRRNMLLAKFKSIENIQKASESELTDAGLDKKSAQNVLLYFK